MRRLWAHIIIAFTCLVAVFASFPSALKGIKTNGDYEKRRQFTFELTERVDAETNEVVKTLDDNSAKDMAAVMESRLIASNITSYEISTSGKNEVTVSFRADNETSYNQITTYLCFSGSFALINQDPNGEPIVGSDLFNGSAYLKDVKVNEYPTVIIPIKTDSEAYEGLIKWAQDNKVSSSSGDDGETTETAPIYLIYNYEVGDTYKTLEETNELSNKVLLSFDASDEATLYYDNEADDKALYQTCGFQDSNGNGYADASEVRAAFAQADFLYNLFHSESLDYSVKVTKGLTDETKVWVDAKVETIKVEGRYQFTSTMVAVLAAFVIISLLLIVFYRLGALSIVTTTIVSSFLAFLFMILTGMEFNALAVVGLVLVASLGLVSGVIYSEKLKNECYRGRTLKKANAEASRKSTLPIVDVHVVAMILGVLLYALGGSALHSMSSILILGSLVSILISTLGLKGLMWLATNTTKLTGKYKVFGIDEDKVPNYMQEEKQSFYGNYADVDLTVRKKSLSIVGLVAATLSLAGIIASACVNGGALYKSNSSQISGGEIYVVNKIEKLSDDADASLSQSDVEALFGKIKLYNEGENKDEVLFTEEDQHATLASYVDSFNTFSYEESKTDDLGTKTYLYTYYEVSLKEAIDGSKVFAKHSDITTGEDMTLDALFAYIVDTNENLYDTISVKLISTYVNEQSVKWGRVALASVIAMVIITLYLLLRYRLSRGLATLVYPLGGSMITLGLFILISLIGLTIPANVAAVVPVVTLISYYFLVMIMNKERENIIEDKVKDNSVDHRKDLSIKSLGMVFSSLLLVLVLTAYLFINFFGFDVSVTSFLWLAALVGIGMSFGFIAVTYVPLANWLYKLFSNVNVNKKPRKKKTNKPVKQKSAEPEEAIFIGIND